MTEQPSDSQTLTKRSPERGHESPGRLYLTPAEALKAVQDDYLYWTGKLTDTSFQLSLGVIAANWAAFGSLDKILGNIWAKTSMGLVVAGLAVSLVAAKSMSELHRARVDYAEENPSRWATEFGAPAKEADPWPFTRPIGVLGRAMREAKTWIPLTAGAAFLAGLFA